MNVCKDSLNLAFIVKCDNRLPHECLQGMNECSTSSVFHAFVNNKYANISNHVFSYVARNVLHLYH